MQLYKKRDFSGMFQDTFAFIKQNGMHFFKHFFLVIGVFLLILLVIGYFFMSLYSQLFLGSIEQSSQNFIDNFLNNNGLLFAILGIVVLIISLVVGFISYVFPSIYLLLYNEHNGKHFGTKEIVQFYKSQIRTLFVFFLSGLLISIPIIAVLIFFIFILVFTIIGVLFIPIIIGAFMLFFSMALLEYLEKKKGIWKCFSYSWSLMKVKFWAAVGSVGIFYLMAYILQNVPAIIIYFAGIIQMLTDTDNGYTNPTEYKNTMTMLLQLIFVISFILGGVLNAIIQINQGIVYFSLKEHKEQINTKSVIDQIRSVE